jgi:hypothetical protein
LCGELVLLVAFSKVGVIADVEFESAFLRDTSYDDENDGDDGEVADDDDDDDDNDDDD